MGKYRLLVTFILVTLSIFMLYSNAFATTKSTDTFLLEKFQTLPGVEVTEFTEVHGGRIYTPEILFDAQQGSLMIKWYDFQEQSTGNMYIDDAAYAFPVIAIRDNMIIYLNYQKHELRVTDMEGTLKHSIVLDSKYSQDSFPGAVMSMDLTDNGDIIINNVFNLEDDNIQIYSLDGNLVGGFSKTLGLTACDNIFYKNDKVYCFEHESVEIYDLSGKRIKLIKFAEDDHNQNFQYAKFGNYFATVSDKYLSLYTDDFSLYKRIGFKELFPELGDGITKFVGDGEHLYIFGKDTNTAYRLNKLEL